MAPCQDLTDRGIFRLLKTLPACVSNSRHRGTGWTLCKMDIADEMFAELGTECLPQKESFIQQDLSWQDSSLLNQSAWLHGPLDSRIIHDCRVGMGSTL